MKTKRMLLPGQFVEAFLYFDFLWLVSEEGDTWAFDILAFLEDSGASAANVNAFARNDRWSDDDDSLLDNGTIELTQRQLEDYSRIFNTRIASRSILDMRCYNSRAYIATDTQVVMLSVFGRDELAHVANGRRANGQLGGSTIMDARCFQLRCQFGGVNLACGSEGGWYASGASTDDRGWKPEFSRYAEGVLAAEFVADRLTTIGNDLQVTMFRTALRERVNEAPDDDIYDDKFEIARVEDRDADTESKVSEELKAFSREHSWEPSRLFLSKSFLFASGGQGEFASVRLAGRNELAVSVAKEYSPAPGPIISMSTSSGKMVAELYDSAYAFADKKWHRLFDGELYSIRGYPSSKWYKRLVTAVGQDRTELIFLK